MKPKVLQWCCKITFELQIWWCTKISGLSPIPTKQLSWKLFNKEISKAWKVQVTSSGPPGFFSSYMPINVLHHSLAVIYLATIFLFISWQPLQVIHKNDTTLLRNFFMFIYLCFSLWVISRVAPVTLSLLIESMSCDDEMSLRMSIIFSYTFCSVNILWNYLSACEGMVVLYLRYFLASILLI